MDRNTTSVQTGKDCAPEKNSMELPAGRRFSSTVKNLCEIMNEAENTVSFVMYVFDPNKMDEMLRPVTKAELKDVKPLEVNDEFKAKLDDVLENATPGTPSGKLSTMKDVGVATYTASNGKTYIGIAIKCEGTIRS